MARRKRGASKTGPDPFDPLDGPISTTIDLHGFRGDEVRTHLPRLLAEARRANPGCLIHVITGKGRRSPGAPVLKGVVRKLLRDQTPATIEAWAPDVDEGGFLIRMRK
jgi:DNA-nicking Smr family endonuclease